MSDETEQAPAAVEEAPPASETPAPEPAAGEQRSPAPVEEPAAAEEESSAKKSVTFDSELTFDEAQAEISAIRNRAGQTRDSLRTSITPPPKPSYTSSSGSSSSASKSYNYESEAPKSKNMLSHLNSQSAMLNYKVQTARSLVRKQEDLLRNLARMRENMERSENEIGKASDFYTSGRYLPKRYDSYKTVSASRSQVEPSSEPASTPLPHVETDRRSDRAYSPTPAASISSFSLSSKPRPVASLSCNDYEPDEDFEREMAAIRMRVANITKQANETQSSSKYSPYYDYDYLLGSSSSAGAALNSRDTYKVSEPSYEVKPISASAYSSVPASYSSYYSPSAYIPYSSPSSVSLMPSSYGGTTESLVPHSSYTEYVLDSLNEIPVSSCTSNLVSDAYPTSPSSYYSDLIPTSADLSVVY